jgi:hypothetical protein
VERVGVEVKGIHRLTTAATKEVAHVAAPERAWRESALE